MFKTRKKAISLITSIFLNLFFFDFLHPLCFRKKRGRTRN